MGLGSSKNKGDPSQPSFFQMVRAGYKDMVNCVIRPPRHDYSTVQLGPESFEIMGHDFQRIDFELINKTGLSIKCSLWEPLRRTKETEQLPCVIYMHGNASCRLEAMITLPMILSRGCCLLAFDFTGSGISEGDYVTLGWNEREDLDCVIDFLRNSGRVSSIGLWGRSMGAVTALLHSFRDPSIGGMVLDSAFSDLKLLAKEMVQSIRDQGVKAPGFLASGALRLIRNSVKKKAGFDINNIAPLKECHRSFIPALFAAAKDDNFINPHHSKDLNDTYAGDSELIEIEGDHNTPRPRRFLKQSANFFLDTLRPPAEAVLIPRSEYPPPLMFCGWGSNEVTMDWSDAEQEMIMRAQLRSLQAQVETKRRLNYKPRSPAKMHFKRDVKDNNNKTENKSKTLVTEDSAMETRHTGLSKEDREKISRKNDDDEEEDGYDHLEPLPFFHSDDELGIFEESAVVDGKWTCQRCTFLNEISNTHCSICESSRQMYTDIDIMTLDAGHAEDTSDCDNQNSGNVDEMVTPELLARFAINSPIAPDSPLSTHEEMDEKRGSSIKAFRTLELTSPATERMMKREEVMNRDRSGTAEATIADVSSTAVKKFSLKEEGECLATNASPPK
eukprot:TRINITY_DN9716_c0_g3_i1.p1 TRINITY_DN9716_c0_g3~~TRINITY_DN9716_c0_g3_i1.p1  ORF type:complete len:615 (-),score=174.93 TRINITY_DN9716_c0_g3_i1:118-1962(-)